ncbi:alpha-galactosidase A precursor [Teratosphaeria destructans]|uniref:Alpha-galactosidase A n=1 Tax=Teratosphaeria destructans TaxID=418781 RepID=A0A9W7SVJ7_9PEZI|nr:alpha-galactosidase A precursor [Teratosphaeria destructans]
MADPPTVELLQASVDLEDEDSYFRFLVNGNTIKYLTVAPGMLAPGDMAFSPTLLAFLPPFPPGDWNEARVSLDSTTGRPHFETWTHRDLPGITSIWHADKFDHLQLHIGEKLRSAVYSAVIPPTKQGVVKLAIFDWQIDALDHETTAYHWIEGQDIGPAFRGHVTEHGRVIGFLMDRIADARRGGPEDLEVCQAVLGRLHGLGLKHGDVNRHNFLIHDGRATMIDFEGTRRCEDPAELAEEMASLAQQLSDESGLGGVITTAS